MNEILKKARTIATIHHRCEEALSLVDSFLNTNPKDVDALLLKGNILELMAYHLEVSASTEQFEVNDFKESSRKCYEELLKIAPENPVVYKDLGDYWEDKNDKKKALEFYDQSIALLKAGKFYSCAKEEIEAAYWAKYELLKDTGNTEKAIECLEEGKKLYPESKLLGGV